MDILVPLFFEILRGIVLFVGVTVSVSFLSMGIWILMNPDEVQSNREALSMYHSGCPLTQMPFDYRSRINPGIAVNKNNQWVLVGSLTDYAISPKNQLPFKRRWIFDCNFYSSLAATSRGFLLLRGLFKI